MPLRFPRPVVPVIATGMAAVWVLAGSAPAFADQVRQHEWWLGKLNVSQAWQTSKGDGVTVAVLSDGIDTTQPDLSGSASAGPDYTNSGETASTYVGLQGTVIASLLAGRGHGAGSTSGVIGVAPGARILSVRVTLDASDPALASTTIAQGLPDAIAAGIRYAVRHGAKVIDLPLDPGQPGTGTISGTTAGGATPTTGTTAPPGGAGTGGAGAGGAAAGSAAAGGSSAEKAAVAYALSKKVVLVAPAGDNGTGTDAVNYPAAYPGVISVGAFDKNFVKAPYSSHQSYVTLTAAGAGLDAAKAGSGYAVVSSTAAASAVVSGIAALIRSRYPSLSPAQVTTALTSSTVYRPVGGMKHGSGHGTVDAQRALATAGAMAAPDDERAGAGAAARVRPTQPSAEAVSSGGLVPRVLRAAIISAGVLILLLLLIALYTASSRRRERKDTAASAEWARSAQNAYSPYGPGEADRMLEFFAAPADPAAEEDPFPRAQGAGFPAGQFPGDRMSGDRMPADQFPVRQPAGAGETAGGRAGAGGIGGTRAAAGASAGAGAAGAAGAAAAGAGTDRVGAWVPLGPASRAQGRPARVSGTPPWEPAAEPDSELPWASVPGPAAATAIRRPAPPGSGPASESVWPSVASGPPAPAPSGSAQEDPAASSGGAVRAMPGDGMPPPGPLADAPPTPPVSPTPPASPAFEPAASSPGGSLWDAADRPRSPTGTAWELPDSEPEQPADAADATHWQQAGDAYRQPATAEVQWRSAASEADSELTTAGEAQPADGDLHWLPAAPDTRWEPAGQDSRWQQAAGGDANWQPSPSAETNWQPADSDAHWQPVAAGAPWEPAAPDMQPESVSRDSQRQAADSDAYWQPGASAATRWEPGARADESAGEEEQLFAWRPAAQTETFPAVSDD